MARRDTSFPVWRKSLICDADSIGEALGRIAEAFDVSEFGGSIQEGFEFEAYHHTFTLTVKPTPSNAAE